MSTNLSIQNLRDRNISINLIEYRDMRETEWKIVIFDKAVGFRNGNIVLVAQDFYLVDGDALIYVCPVSDIETTNEKVIPYLQSQIDRAVLLE